MWIFPKSLVLKRNKKNIQKRTKSHSYTRIRQDDGGRKKKMHETTPNTPEHTVFFLYTHSANQWWWNNLYQRYNVMKFDCCRRKHTCQIHRATVNAVIMIARRLSFFRIHEKVKVASRFHNCFSNVRMAKWARKRCSREKAWRNYRNSQYVTMHARWWMRICRSIAHRDLRLVPPSHRKQSSSLSRALKISVGDADGCRMVLDNDSIGRTGLHLTVTQIALTLLPNIFEPNRV